MAVILTILHYLIYGYSLVLIIYALMSWLPGAPDSTLGRFFARLSRPLIEPLNRIIPSIGMLNFTVLIAIILLQLADFAIIQFRNWFIGGF